MYKIVIGGNFHFQIGIYSRLSFLFSLSPFHPPAWTSFSPPNSRQFGTVAKKRTRGGGGGGGEGGQDSTREFLGQVIGSFSSQESMRSDVSGIRLETWRVSREARGTSEEKWRQSADALDL